MPQHSPVLFLLFNRPDTTKLVFERIRQYRPARLYVAADGPRPGRSEEAQLCNAARAVVETIDWPCEVKQLYRAENLGCKKAVSSAITWFFEQEEEGIILEDDCVPSADFFTFCNDLLNRYRNDERVSSITGSNLQAQRWGNASYYFSECSNVWGWASWQRVWKQYDPDLKSFSESDAASLLNNLFTDRFVVEEWMRIFKELKAGRIDTWDYQFHFMNFFQRGLCATPNVNLVSNMGFRPDATHTHNPDRYNANRPPQQLGKITHPANFVAEKQADHFVFSKEFFLEEKWNNYRKNNLPRRKFKRWVRRFFGGE